MNNYNILFNKLLKGELLIFTTSQKKDSRRTIPNKIKKVRDKKTRQFTRYINCTNYINNSIKKGGQND